MFEIITQYKGAIVVLEKGIPTSEAALDWIDEYKARTGRKKVFYRNEQ